MKNEPTNTIYVSTATLKHLQHYRDFANFDALYGPQHPKTIKALRASIASERLCPVEEVGMLEELRERVTSSSPGELRQSSKRHLRSHSTEVAPSSGVNRDCSGATMQPQFNP